MGFRIAVPYMPGWINPVHPPTVGYLSAGIGSSTYNTTVGAYTGLTDAWAAKSAYPVALYDPAGATHSSLGGLCVNGGASSGNRTDCNTYLPDAWTGQTACSTSRGNTGRMLGVGIGASCYAYEGGSSVMEKFTSGTWTLQTAQAVQAHEPCPGGLFGYCYRMCGGTGGATYGNTVYRFDPNTNSWAIKTNYGTNIDAPWASSLSDIAYMFGGTYLSGTATNRQNCDAYTEDAWTAKTGFASLGQARTQASGFTVGSYVFMVNGLESPSNTRVAYNWRYDPAGDSWATKTNCSHSNYKNGCFST